MKECFSSMRIGSDWQVYEAEGELMWNFDYDERWLSEDVVQQLMSSFNQACGLFQDWQWSAISSFRRCLVHSNNPFAGFKGYCFPVVWLQWRRWKTPKTRFLQILMRLTTRPLAICYTSLPFLSFGCNAVYSPSVS